MIARKAGVDPALVRYYFSSREELFLAVAENILITWICTRPVMEGTAAAKLTTTRAYAPSGSACARSIVSHPTIAREGALFSLSEMCRNRVRRGSVCHRFGLRTVKSMHYGALRWATTRAWERSVTEDGDALLFVPDDTPREIRRRIVLRAIGRLATEGKAGDLRGRELERVLGALSSGGKATMRGVLCAGGLQWRFTKAPPRKG